MRALSQDKLLLKHLKQNASKNSCYVAAAALEIRKSMPKPPINPANNKYYQEYQEIQKSLKTMIHTKHSLHDYQAYPDARSKSKRLSNHPHQ